MKNSIKRKIDWTSTIPIMISMYVQDTVKSSSSDEFEDEETAAARAIKNQKFISAPADTSSINSGFKPQKFHLSER